MTLSSNITDKFLPALAASSVTLLPLIANSVIGGLQGRSARNKRDNAIAAAKSRVDFLSDWIKAQEQVSTPDHLAELKQSTSEELDAIRQSVLKAVHETEAKSAELVDRRRIQRVFLLYWPRTLGGWLFHALFYLSLSMLFILIVLVISSAFPTAGSPSTDFGSMLAALLVFGIPIAVFGFGMQRLALHADDKENERIAKKLQPSA